MTDRRTFAPVVLVGLASAGLCAAAGNQPWATGSGDSTSGFGNLSSTLTATLESGKVPAATAAALVVLASWGVVLVTRGRVRRAVAVLGALAALGVVVTVVVGFTSAPDGVRDAYAQLGITDPDVTLTAWYWVAVAASLVSLAATALAVRWVPAWPVMGSRYDAPTDSAPAAAVPPPEELSELELWKAMDEGRDPTVLD